MEIQPITSKPHKLSEQHSIAPAHSAKAGTPVPTGLSLYSARKNAPYWLYNWGHLEVYLLSNAS
jgi:hypothetical protein